MAESYFQLNRRMLVSDAEHIASKGLNAQETPHDQPNVPAAVEEHKAAVAAYVKAGIKIEHVASPAGCQDGVFTANWGLSWGGRVLLSRLPNLRRAEEPHAERALKDLGFEVRRAKHLFSGQGDSLPIGGNRVIMGRGFRNSPEAAREVKNFLGLEPVVVPAKPKRWLGFGPPVKNKVTGLYDSYYYDIDLAVAVIRPNLLAVCLDALTREGRNAIMSLDDIAIIPVSLGEAKHGLACNLVSTGDTVIMIDSAPKLAASLREHGLEVVTLPNHELRKGGGGFRCISLSLYS